MTMRQRRHDDADLLRAVGRLAGCERAATVSPIASLAELDARRLYLGAGCSSLFTYCTQVLHLSEHAAYGRIEAARAARRFPVILEWLADGAITLTTVCLLAPHLTEATWIDGVRRRLDDTRYVQRFTPRQPNSYWSVVNTRRAGELIRARRMAPAGLQAFEKRDPSETVRYSFEREASQFTPAQLKQFKANRAAWQFFESQSASYRRVATFWVVSAKKEETRARRLATLIADSAAGRRIGLMARDTGVRS